MSVSHARYESGDYWHDRLWESSDYKVGVALRALSKANFALRPGISALEVGCGNGAFLFPMAKALEAKTGDFSLRGIDIAENAIEYARQVADSVGDKRISFDVCSASEVKETFDVVFLMDVVEHVTDPYHFLSSVRNLAPVVAMHLPIEQSLAHSLLSKPRKSYELFRHIHFFSLESARILIEEAGFELMAIQFTAASPEVFTVRGGLATKASRVLRYAAYKAAPHLSSRILGGSVMLVMRPR